MMRFMSFTSGSCGNCSLLSAADENTGEKSSIVIDAGISMRAMKAAMLERGLEPFDFDAVILTHDHMDHIRHLGSWCKKLGVPVYATEALHRALSYHPFTAPWIGPCRRVLGDGWNDVSGFIIKYFHVPHDATETVGYAIRYGERMLVLMTDLGSVPPEAANLAREADTVIIESNYDTDMLLGGSYPEELKKRIIEGYGHLSNADAAEAVRSFIHPGLKNLFLCHISGNNNTPKLAYDSMAATLRSLGFDPAALHLRVLPRGVPTPLLYL